MLTRLAAIAILGLALAGRGSAQVDEYRVKAAFLYNFARFIEWPARTFHAPGDPIVICIAGQNPFGDSLDEAIRGKVLDGRPFVVQLISDLPPKSSCQILFVNSSARKQFRTAAGSFKSGILTVGDEPGFIDDGGVINFKVEGGRIRFEIHVEAAEKAQLKISSKLLSLAQIVGK